ncbi:Myb-like DNA-binding domain protein [Penicillium hispanicum]|uniref:Myb-like DNA-binding domain protein n=1 Tax=Penicillium hispanicum TaxID=1080232 RepID=UPI002541B4B8|nr:Myb-like DNA-binding domain protein [Penicillium hispanicum]KAJ5591867.1 Myb-like DNA-binding domain protein [Penicillium hispanicum]
MIGNTVDPTSDNLERPLKRPRLSFTPGSPEEPTEEWDLQAARDQNNLRLKSVFEGIFSKYGKDFTEVGDEIDLETGRIVVDNGHLLGMREERDTGDPTAQAWLFEEGLSETTDQKDEAHNPETGDLEDRPPSSPNGKRDELLDGSGTEGEANADLLCDSALAGAESDYPDTRPISNSLDVSEDVFKDSGPTDPLWQAPELPAIFSTPTSEARRANVAATPQLPRLTREASPPGSGSLWTVPRRGRPRTEGKPKATPSKSRPRAKRKHHSSPVARDWSFTKTPDGNESDDPLQEYQPSPTPLKAKNIRGKRQQRPLSQTDPQLESRQSSPYPERVSRDQSATKAQEDGQGQNNHAEEDNNAPFETAPAADNGLQSDSSTKPHSHVLTAAPVENTPVTPKRPMTPDETRLIVCMRYVQGKKWTEIIDALPGRKLPQIHRWNYFHWTDRRKHPPKLSAPWSLTELETLASLKDQPGLSWPAIKEKVPRRLQAEIEFELLRLWVGDEVWKGEQRPMAVHEGEAGSREEKVEAPEAPFVTTRRPSVTGLSKTDPPVSAQEFPRHFEAFIDEDNPLSVFSEASSPSKLSAIYMDSPVPSRQGSRTPSRASPAKRIKLAF